MSASRSTRRESINPVIETLEIRRLLSADLTGTFTGTLPPVLQSGDRNHLAVHVTNEGDAPAAGKVTVDLFASSDSSNDSDVLLGTVTRQMNLKSGRGANVNFRFAEPSTLADGQYTLVGVVDSSRLSNVTTTDDTFVAPQLVTAQQPAADLTSEMVNAPAQSIFINDGNVSPEPASVLVKNRGEIPADGDMTLSFYLSTDQTLDAGDYLAGRLSNTPVNLKPGQGKMFSEELIASSDVPGGDYYLLALAKPGAGIVQKSAADEVGVASRQVDVDRPAMLSSANPIDNQPSSQKTPPQPIEAQPEPTTTPTDGADSSTPPATSDTSTSTGCDDGSQSCDDGGQSCDDGSQSGGDDCQPTDDGGDDGSQDDQQPDQGQDDSSQDTQDNSSNDNSQQDDSNQGADNSNDQDTSTQDDSGQTTDDSGDQGDDSQDNSDQSTDDSGDQSDGSQDDSGQQSDSGSDDSGGDSTDGWIDTDAFRG